MSAMTRTFRDRALDATGRVLPYLLAIAFIFSYYTYIGTAVILALCAWYLALNARAVPANRWAMVVIAFFALIAAKDGIMWLAGSGSFKALAKSGSRVFVLAGCAALLDAERGDRLERTWLKTFGITAAAMALIFALMRSGMIQRIYNVNLFGMQSLWFPLALAIGARTRSPIQAAAILAVGLGILAFDGYWPWASFPGSRSAPLAFAATAVFALLPRKPATRIAAAILVIAAAAGIAFLSTTYNRKLDDLLIYRQELWNAYAAKGAERPLTGWGYTESAENQALVAESLKGKRSYDQVIAIGSGPHNAFLAMFFENGIVFAIAYAALLAARFLRAGTPLGFLDLSLVAYSILMSTDAMNPGGLTFLGFFLGICLLGEGEGGPNRENGRV